MALCRMRQGRLQSWQSSWMPAWAARPRSTASCRDRSPRTSSSCSKAEYDTCLGGAASGFHHVEDAPHQATLAQIKVGQLAPLLQVLMQQQALHAYRSLPYSQRSAASPAL